MSGCGCSTCTSPSDSVPVADTTTPTADASTPVDGGSPPCPPPPCPVEKIKKNLEACDGGTGAWAAAKKATGKEPQVQVAPTSSGFAAETEVSTGTITIKPTTDCCDATESLLFELHNLESSAKFNKIDADALKGNLSREEYTRATERVEYDGLKRSLTAFDKCKETWGAGPGAKSFAEAFKPAKDFDDYYNHYESKAHKDTYRTWWDNSAKAAYDKKHTRKHP